MSDTSNNEAGTEPTLEEELAAEEAKINQEAQGSEGEEETPASDSAPEENSQETKSEETPDEGKSTEEMPSDLTDDEKSQLSAKAQKRIKFLSERAKRADELEKLEAQRGQTQQPKTPPTRIPDIVNRPLRPTPPSVAKGKLPWETDSEEGNEDQTEVLTQEQMDENTRRVVQEENQKTEILTNLKNDIKAVEDKYPILNADSDDFDQELSDWIAESYQLQFENVWNKSGHKEAMSFLEYADKVMSLREKGAEQGRKELGQNLDKQAAEQAVTPAGAPSDDKGSDVEGRLKSAKTIDELDRAAESLPKASN